MELIGENWLSYLIAAGIGLLVGVEREKAQPHSGTMGVRTFVLISLLGALAGNLQNSWIAILLAAFSLSLIVISYFTQTHTDSPSVDRGLTTEFAAGVIFVLGFVAHESPALSALIGPLVALILFSKKSLHKITYAIRPAELEAALIVLLAGVVVIQFFPDRIIDPWGIFNPKKFGYIVLTLAVLEFLSYLITKVLGEKGGALIIGFLGGLVSSTTVLLFSAHEAKKSPQNWRNLIRTTIAAKLAALIELVFIIGYLSPPLILKVAGPLGLSVLFGIGAIVILSLKKDEPFTKLNLRSPLDWRGTIRLSLILAAIFAGISFAKIWFGEQGAFTISFLTGLFELHGVSLATATMHSQGQLSTKVANLSISLAIVASLAAKVVIAWVASPGIFARAITAIFLPMIAVFAIAAWVFQTT